MPLLPLSSERHMCGTWRRGGQRRRRRRRGEEEWLRFHYILYMSKMPGRLLPASLPAPCWESAWVFEHMHTLGIFLTLSLRLLNCQDFRFLKWIYPTGLLRAAPISHCCTERWREVERNGKKRQDKTERRGEALQHVWQIFTVVICVFFSLINCCCTQALLAARLM